MRIVLVALVSFAGSAWAGNPWVGSWAKREAQGAKLVLTIEDSGGGKLTLKYRLDVVPPKEVMTCTTHLDGKDEPCTLDGKPTGMTMAIKQPDARTWDGIVKVNGKVMERSKGQLSADGKQYTNEEEYVDANPTGQKGPLKSTWEKR